MKHTAFDVPYRQLFTASFYLSRAQGDMDKFELVLALDSMEKAQECIAEAINGIKSLTNREDKSVPHSLTIMREDAL